MVTANAFLREDHKTIVPYYKDPRKGLVYALVVEGRYLALNTSGRRARAVTTRLFETVLALAGENEKAARTYALTNIGVNNIHGGNYNKAAKYLQQALVVAEENQDHERIAAICLNAALNCVNLNQYEEAMRLGNKGIEAATKAEVWKYIAFIAGNLSNAALKGGRYLEGAAELLDTLETLDSKLPDYHRAYLMDTLGNLMMEGGKLGEAEAQFKKAEELYKTAQHDDITVLRATIAQNVLYRAEALSRRGEKSAMPLFEQARKIGADIESTNVQIAYLIESARAASRLALFDTAIERAQQAIAYMAKHGIDDMAAQPYHALAEAQFLSGHDWHEAAQKALKLAKELDDIRIVRLMETVWREAFVDIDAA